MKEICNPSHLNQVSHIDLNTATLVCSQDVPQFQAQVAKLAPIREYAYENGELLKKVHSDTHNLLAKLENAMASHPHANPVFEKIEKAFNLYVTYVHSVKEKLILKLKKPNLGSNQNLANEFCAFAEEASVNNINMKKAIINNEQMNIRKFCLNQTAKKMQEKLNYYVQNLFSQNNQPQAAAGYDVLFKNPFNDADAILNHVGIALVGYKEAKFNNLISLKETSPIQNEEPLSSPTNPFRKSISPPRPYSPNVVANSPTNRFETNKQTTIDSLSNVSIKIDPLTTIHHYDKDSHSFLLFSPLQKKKFYIKVDNVPIFPFEGCFPSKYFKSYIFFCGGMNENQQILKTTFMFDLIQGKFIKRTDMKMERAYHCIEQVGDNMIALGGKTNNQDTSNCELFNSNLNDWEPFPNMLSPKSSAVSFGFQTTLYIGGGGPDIKESVILECIKLHENEKVWKLVQFKSALANYSFPRLCANSCNMGNGKFIIFGGFSVPSMNLSCIYNSETDTVESFDEITSGYYTITNQSQSLNIHGDIVAIDDSKKVHLYSPLSRKWTILDTIGFEQIDFK